MTTTFEIRARMPACAARRLPENSRSGQPRSLAEAVRTEAQSIDERTLKPAVQLEAGLAFQPRTLLVVLSYCYARQTYSSTEVTHLFRRDPDFRHLFHEKFPDARIVHRFSRDNREALHRCLTAALRFLAEEKVAQGTVTRIDEMQLAEEARRRIIMAMFIDCMELGRDQTPIAPLDLCYLFASKSTQRH